MKKLFYTCAMLLSISMLYAQTQVPITDEDLGSETYNWTADNEYILDGYVYLEEGGVLNIEAGTVIKGKAVTSTGDLTSALIITRGAQINAEGTSDNPIIFTSELDDVSDPSDLTDTDNQLWGGLIVLGRAPIGEDGDEDVIEGIPSDEPRIKYGGDQPEDNSGVIKYVSIRHGGSVLGGDNEINGLTLGGVGNGTTIEYVEVFANKDDGIEFFGGTVNVTHAVVAFCGDDSYDFDESWNGYVQFALAVQGEANGQGDNAVEYDGTENSSGMPNDTGRIYNGTFIGAGAGAANPKSNGLLLKAVGNAQIWNSIFVDQVGVVYTFDNAGDAAIAGNIAFNFNADLISGDEPAIFQVEQIDPDIAVSRATDGMLDPRPNAGSPALSGAANPAEEGVVRTDYRGAFNNRDNWALGWTAMDEYGYFGDIAQPEQNVITDADIEAGESLTLTPDREWILDGYVYVEEGATLTILPGTVVKGKAVPSTGDLTSALIITRGAILIAEGTAEDPIIMTSELDDMSTTDDLTDLDNQLWGGLIVLGSAPIGEDGDEDVIEGIPSDEPRIKYGGDQPQDSSGVIKYVSVRHGGSVLGGDNEINGITLGGVGNKTVIEYVEVFANKDDGIEFFGGTVNVKHAVVGFVGDDSYDFDESWNGHVQFALAVQGEANGQGDNAIEYDGTENSSGMPNETGRIYNGTFIGAGSTAANPKSNGLLLKAVGNAQIWNSVFVDQIGPVYTFDNAGEAAIAGNIAFNFNGALLVGPEPGIFDVEQVDPLIAVSRKTDMLLDPRPTAGSPALSGAAEPSEDGVVKTSYRGAFNNRNNWALGWTAMDQYGYFGDIAQPEQNVIVDADIEAGESLTLTNDREWILDGYVYVEEGATLTIEPGTVIKGKAVPSTGDLTSALIITRGATLIAEGTAAQPIIMTSELDDLSTTEDLTDLDNQLWGGLIVLGNAPIGEDGDEDVIEGIPSDEPRIKYGGDDPEDNSGIIRYVSLRHGGSVLGGDNEINGLTLGGVGRGTTIEYVEVFANKDDGIEFFGGTVNVNHAVVGFVGDDSYDFDESWDGFVQFALAVQGAANGQGDNAIEYDGTENSAGTPNATGRIYNGTFIGAGGGSANAKSNGLLLKAVGNAQVWNSIFVEQVGPVYTFDNAGEGAIAGNIAFNYNGDLLVGPEPAIFQVEEVDPLISISRNTDGMLDPRPNAGSAALSGAAVFDEEGVVKTDFRGAFNNRQNWALGWTAMDQYGYFGDIAQPEQNVITDEDIVAGEDITLTNDREWILDGYVYAESGSVLTIEPGTVIKAKAVPSTGDLTSALIITRGSRIIAEGTREQPIIMTSELDDMSTTDDLTDLDNQLWGGLIVLGSAPIGEDGDEDVIEGIPSDEPRIRYGGDNPNDDSGIIKYVSIRHGGSVLGGDNEINGLTLGGVGNGTTIEYVEVFANKDDGIEFFGGTVNVTHAIVGFVGDDSYDFDESWNGYVQFALAVQGEANGQGDNAIEYDGTENSSGMPNETGRIYNGTFIGAGGGSANPKSNGLLLKAVGKVQVWNSIFVDQVGVVYTFDNAGESAIAGNIAHNFNSTLVSGDQPDVFQVEEVDPLIEISRQTDNQLDPRLPFNSPALTGAATHGAADAVETTYRGAFGANDDWAFGWSALWTYGYFGDISSTQNIEDNRVAELSVFPNPVGDHTTVRFDLKEALTLSVNIYDADGKLIRNVCHARDFQQGEHQLRVNTADLPHGTFVITMSSNGQLLSKNVVIK